MHRPADPIIATVGIDHKVTVELPDLRPGETVEVVVRPHATPSKRLETEEDFMSWLRNLKPSGRTAEEVDRSIREERDAWDRD